MNAAKRKLRGPASVLLAFLLAAGCDPPDRPPTLVEGLPASSVDYLDPDRISTFRLDEGVVYRSVRSGSRPWQVHLLEVDVSRCELGFQVVRADEEGLMPVSELARRSRPGALAAVNGDFFTPEGVPLGLEVSDGRLRGRGSRPVFAWQPGELPWIGPVEWEDGRVRLGGWTVPTERPDFDVQVVGGSPALVEGGAPVPELVGGDGPEASPQRNPRTAVGLDGGAMRLWLVVVDGRRAGVSEGMTLPELAELFVSLGADTAVNLDGGGSSVMVVRGSVVSRPSDLLGQRPVANALVVRSDPAYCERGPSW